ncbi:MAG: peptide ABC transporter substrate-binding protein [Chloroflexota bacterium]|nr:peptide ABC transporter substrate-binding protein [Chloroflexota bacterium]
MGQFNRSIDRTRGALAALGVTMLLLAQCTAAPAAPSIPASTPIKKGGTVTLALSSEPDTLNPYLASQRAAGEVHVFVIEGLLGVNERGDYFPVLAKEVPTKENGGVSADGLTITYHLKPNVTWSDGEAFTCNDVRFTWQVITNPNSAALTASDYREIAAVTCPDALTAVVTFKEFYAPYLVPFWAILPRHATGDPAALSKWEYNRKPIGTGPFRIAEWLSGDHITLVRNERYRDAAQGKPYLDSVIIRFVPSRDVALQLLQTGEVTLVGDLVEANLPQLSQAAGIVVSSTPGPRSERLVLNLGDPSVDAANPVNQPHPILADARVRQALEEAIDKQELVDQLLNGKGAVGTNELSIGWARCATPPSAFDPDHARQLLDEAGWKMGADGIRVAQGAPFAKDGTRLRLKLQGPTGDAVREQVEQVLVDRWKQVGIEAYIENMPTAALFGTWDSGSVARHGKFDILIYSTGLPIADPQSQIEGLFASWNIPSPSNKGTGFNYARWIDSAADSAIQAASATADLAARRDAYCHAMAEVNRDRPLIYLYARASITAYRDRLQGWRANVWKNLGWNAAEWWMK